MRFMGDHSMSRGQTDIDCLLYLLKVPYSLANRFFFDRFDVTICIEHA